MRLPPFNPYIAIVIAVISVSASAIFVKLITDAPAGIIAFYRLLLASLFMLPLVLTKFRHEFKKLTRKQWITATISGLFLSLHFIVWFESLNYTSVASSVILVSIQPLFAFIGTFLFFGERFSVAAVISMFITLFGSVIISWGDFQISGLALFGNILALFGAVAATVYFMIGQNLRKSLSLITYTFIVYATSAGFLFIYNVIMSHSFGPFTCNTWILFLALAIIPTFLGHTLLNWALRWVSTSTVSMALVFEPIGAAVLAYIILNETVTPFQWLGGTIVIFGLFLFVVSTTRKMNVTISKN